MNEYIDESIEVTTDESFGQSYDKELAWREQVIDDATIEGMKKGFEKGHEQGFEKGHEQGFEKGHEQGFEKGHEQGIAQLVKKLGAKLDIDSIVDLTDLSKEEVEKYLKENS